MTTLGYRQRKARTEKRCDWCIEPIMPGEQYVRWFYLDGSMGGECRMHLDCEGRSRDICEPPEYEYPDCAGTHARAGSCSNCDMDLALRVALVAAS